MAAKNFNAILKIILQFEGGNVDDKRDPGGRTSQGVTQRSFNAWLARHGRPSRDVYTMTDAERDAIYREDFWDKIGGDMLPSGVDALAMDIAVNSGPGRANQWLADSRNLLPGDRIRYLDSRRRSFFKALKTFATFGKGWMRRENAAFALAQKLNGAKS